MNSENLNLFLCGDVMTGRGIDQILKHPCSPRLYESFVQDARDYVSLAERRNGPIPRGVAGSYLWENITAEWENRRPLVKIINLETAVTADGSPWEGKGIHYRMHPRNLDALTSAGFDICALANNHTLDWGAEGLKETIAALRKANIRCAGAGENLDEAMAPAIYSLPGGGRILVFSMGTRSSGIPGAWAASNKKPGVYLLDGLGGEAVANVRQNIERYWRDGDLVVISIHWGGNWGYDIPRSHRIFAHALVAQAHAGVVHGHSSHHPLGVELYQQRPLFYGCGDFLNDYEGIGGFQAYRSELCQMIFLEFAPERPTPVKIEVVPLRIEKFQLHPASRKDAQWLFDTLKKESAVFNTRLTTEDGRTFRLTLGTRGETGNDV